MFRYLGEQKSRILKDKETLEREAKMKSWWLFRYPPLKFERNIIKRYTSAFIYFCFFLSKVYCVVFIAFFIFVYFFYYINGKFFSFFLFSLIFLFICYFLLYFINFFIFFCEVIVLVFIKRGISGILDYLQFKYIYLIITKICKVLFIIFVLLYLFCLKLLKNFIYILKVFIFYFFKISFFIIFNIIYIFLKLVYMVFLIIIFFLYIYFFFRNFLIRIKKKVNLTKYDYKISKIFNIKKRVSIFLVFINWFITIDWIFFKKSNKNKKINNNIKDNKLIIKLTWLWKKSFKFSIKFWNLIKLYSSLIFFFFSNNIYIDRYHFYSWEDTKETLYDYWDYMVTYKYIKYYADRKYFGFSGYFAWRFYILQYKIFIPLTYYLHKWEWKWDVYEMHVFYRLEYTYLERKIMHFYRFIYFYFISERRVKRFKNLIYDFFKFVWLFLIEDLFLYYTQIELISRYSYKFFLFIHFSFIKKLKKIYFFFKFFLLSNLKNSKWGFSFKNKILGFWINLRLFCNFIFISLRKLFLKLKKNFKNLKKVLKFCKIKKDWKFLLKIKLIYFFFFLKIFNYIFGGNFITMHKKTYNLYYLNNSIKLKHKHWLAVREQRRFSVNNILFKNYVKMHRFTIIRGLLFVKNYKELLELVEEKEQLYNWVKTFLSYFSDMKAIKDLTWYDRLTGKDAGYQRLSELYNGYLRIKWRRKKKRRNKFRTKKNYYFFLLDKLKKKK